MRMVGIGFLALLLLEIMSIAWVASIVGGGVTLLLMFLSFVTGMLMLRHTGISGLLLAGAAIREQGRMSVYQLLWPLRYAFAAVLLMSPGFLSSILAVVLLLPLRGKNISGFQTFHFNGETPRAQEQDDDVIEGEYTVNPQNSEQNSSKYITYKDRT